MTSSVIVHVDQRLTWLKQVKVKIIQLKLKLGHAYWMLGLKSPLALDNEILLHKLVTYPIRTYGIKSMQMGQNLYSTTQATFTVKDSICPH